ncbi:MAG: hypothetical protein GY749_28570 [Desulfobacteraceae bacterium]|nr:hypothetical protein [Desulfobacteraceae bacterium]
MMLLVSYGQDNFKFETNIISISLKIKIGEQLSFFDESDQNKQDGEIDENLFVEIKVDNDHDRISYNKFNNIINRQGTTSHPRNTRLNENIDFITSAITDERKLSSTYGHIVDMGMMDAINIYF